MSRMLKNIGLFCRRALQKRPVFCKETCIFKHPTHRSHPIPVYPPNSPRYLGGFGGVYNLNIHYTPPNPPRYLGGFGRYTGNCNARKKERMLTDSCVAYR